MKHIEVGSFEDVSMDSSQEEIYRRWLSEADDEDDHESVFELSEISDLMDEIIDKYEEHSDWVNYTTGDTHDDDTDTDTHRRMAESDTTTVSTALVNEGEWTCDTAEDIIESFEDISLQLEEFIEHCSGEHALPTGVYIVLYCGFVLFIGCLLKYVQHRLHIPVPYTVLLLITGAVLQLLEMASSRSFGMLVVGFDSIREIDPHIVLSLFIPGLIFESAFNTNYHIFLKEAKQAVMLAGPGVLMNACLIGGVMHYFAHSISTFSSLGGYDWGWAFCIMFGSIVSATDPVAVVALLKELGASKRLSTLIEAESLLNDGTAFVMFTVLKLYAKSAAETTFAQMLLIFVQLAFGGMLFGIIGGIVCVYVLSNVYDDFEIEITLTLCLVYLFAFTGDYVLGLSGVLVIVFMGLQVSKNKEVISVNVEESMHHFWEMIGFLANTLLFFLTGQVIAYQVKSTQYIDWATDSLILIMLYICCHITRALAIWQMYPVLQATGYGCTVQDSLVMVYGGLRGAIGLALALIVQNEPEFEQKERDRVLFHVCGIVVLTLVVNAPTVKYVVQYLGLNKPPSDTAALFKSATHHLMDHVHHKLNGMKLDKHYIGANWLKVDELQPNYDELYERIFQMDVSKDYDEVDDVDNELSVGTDGELIINMLAELQRADRENIEKQAVEKRVISVMKSSYWTQYEHGLISADAVNILVESSEDAMDEHDLTKQRKNLKKWFGIPWYIKWMHQSPFRWIKKLSEYLLFGNLGFAVEISSGFVYASKTALEFCHLLSQIDNNIAKSHIVFVQKQLKDVTDWIIATGSDVVRVYPEVHTAIQTQHAAHSLLTYQKQEIEHLLHKGFLDEGEFERVMAQCDASLHTLFHTSYTALLDKNHDDESILLQSPLFSELTDAEKKLVTERAKPSKWFKKGSVIMKMGGKTTELFVLTRGSINIYHHHTVIHVKERGDVLDVYALLQDNEHGFNFVVSTDQCMGYWLDLSLLALLKDSNIDFWDTLWKCAACDVMRFYFKDSQHMLDNVDDLDNIVYQSPLSFFDPHNRYRNEIRVTRGFAILLNGQVVHITDLHNKASAPALLPTGDEPYVAIQDSVVLYLDFDRGDYHTQKTSRINPKLAKLMGLAASMSGDEEEEDEEDDEDEDDFSISDDQKEEEQEDYNNQEKALLSGLKAPVMDDIKNETPVIVRLKTAEEQLSKKRLKTKFSRKESNIGQIDRYRSRSQLNRAAKKELVNTDAVLNDALLPPSVTALDIENEWTIKECFEITKFVISKHEALFEYLKTFHIQHIQSEVLKQAKEEEIEFDPEEAIDSHGDAEALGPLIGILPPESLKKETSLFARPSAMARPTTNQDKSSAVNKLKVMDSKFANKFRSSRYLLTQQRAGTGGVGHGPNLTAHHMQSQVIRKAQTDMLHPAIIQPTNYRKFKKKKRKSSKLEQHKRVANTDTTKTTARKRVHHEQQSTEIDGWETVTNQVGSSQPVIALNAIPQKDEVKIPLKDDQHP